MEVRDVTNKLRRGADCPGFPYARVTDNKAIQVRVERGGGGDPNLLLQHTGDGGDRCPAPEDLRRFDVVGVFNKRLDPRSALPQCVSVCLYQRSL